VEAGVGAQFARWQGGVDAKLDGLAVRQEESALENRRLMSEMTIKMSGGFDSVNGRLRTLEDWQAMVVALEKEREKQASQLHKDTIEKRQTRHSSRLVQVMLWSVWAVIAVGLLTLLVQTALKVSP
jgi:hypothetical protein